MEQTSWNLYSSNPDAWTAMLLACQSAKKSIDLEQFIFYPDEVGNRFIEICSQKAKEGVRVRFLWDAAGSFNFFGSSIVEDLKKKGIELIFFKTLFPSFFELHNYRSWYFRNHRRTLITDNKTGFTGSICISKRMETWRDTNIRLEGPIVHDMKRSFERMWNRAQEKSIPRFPQYIQSDLEFEYITNNPFPRSRYLYKRIVEAIKKAQKYIYITTPYFVPAHRLVHALKRAAKKGIDVRIMLPKQSDYPIVDLGARTFFHNLMKAGVKFYLYKEKMLHCKTIAIDGSWASVGTLNMDNISLLYNFEANIVSANRTFAEEISQHFINDLKNTKEVSLSEWNSRHFVEKTATFLIKLVRDFL